LKRNHPKIDKKLIPKVMENGKTIENKEFTLILINFGESGMKKIFKG
jgi:hypothetical protein